MFEKFGELNSFGEINELAENLFNEGDTESLRAMAKENGIQSDFVDMYLQGEIPALCDQLTAALGKIDVEVAELKPKEIMEDWVEYLRGQCMENELLAFNVRKKGKSLKGCIAALLMWSFKNQQTEQDIIRFCYENMERAVDGLPQYRVDNAIEICDQKKLEEMTRALVRVTEKIENFLRRVGNECEESGLGKDFAVAIAARILVERAERGENEQTTGKETI